MPSDEVIHPAPSGSLQDHDGPEQGFNWTSLDREFDWSRGGPYNVTAEALDRHRRTWRKNKIALYFARSDGSVSKYTFGEMAELTGRFASGLLRLGAGKGDRVLVYLDRTPETYISVAGVAKMGGIAGPLFSALGPEAVKDRALDSGARFLVTSPYLYERILPILDDLTDLERIVVVGAPPIHDGRAAGFDDVMSSGDPNYPAENMAPTDPYIIHYTSGSTGKPKGVLLGHKAMAQQYLACRCAMDLRDDDTFWCTADPGWVTGTSAGIFGPWYLGTSLVSYGGRFDARTWFGLLERFKVSVWYTAPTALRMLMRAGDEVVEEHDLRALRHICSAGEPLNPEVVRWGMRSLGRRIHDHWWQTETGAACIVNLPSRAIKPGSMGRALPGVIAGVVDEDGRELPPGKEGFLALRPGWPSMMVGIWRNTPKFKEHFEVPGWYISGDQAYRDEDGYFWFLGRADDVIKTSGERLGPFEVESALVEHHAVAEAGVIGKPDELRGEIVKAFITLRPGFAPSEALKADITQFVRTRLAYYAYPREIEFVETLPKTRSGKIMRRVLKARELGQDVGDLSSIDE